MKYANSDLQPTNGWHQWLLGIVFVIACTTASLAFAWLAAKQDASEQFQHEAELVLRGIGELVVETRGIMRSMLGMHYASDEFAGSDIEAFAEQLRTYSPYVQAIGMFGVVDAQLQKEYEAYVSDNFGQKIIIRHWSSVEKSGQAVNPVAQETLFPVNLIHPLDTTGYAFLGTDISSVPAIKDILNTLTDSGEGVLLSMPDEWPIAGQAILLQSVYAGALSPETTIDRRESIVGGIWVAIDLQKMLASITTTFPHIKLELSTGTSKQATTMMLDTHPAKPANGLDLRFGNDYAQNEWWIGPSRISAVASAPLLAGKSQLTLLLLGVGSTILLASAVLTILYYRRARLLERSRGELAISAERDKARYTLQSVSHPVLSLDGDYRCVYLNPAAEGIVEGDALKAVGQRVSEFLCLQQDESTESVELEQLCQSLTDGQTLELDVQLESTGMALSTWSMKLSRIAANDATEVGYIMVLVDVSKERQLTSELEHRAHHDPLTGVYNRYYFEHRLHELVQDIDGSNRQHALSFIDLDKFKIVNDTCGHAAGDRLLIELTNALSKLCRRSDVFARLGGDEFGLLITDANSQDALAVAQKFHEHFQSAVFEHEGNVFPVRASMGMANFGGKHRDMKQIMKEADLACYAAKDSGRNALIVYSPDDASMNEKQEEMNWLPVLEKAISENDFEIFLQPIRPVCSADEIGHYECLLRLKESSGAYATPNQFLKAAERYDLMPDIDRWVINRAMDMMRQIEKEFNTSVSFSINLSGLTAADPDLPDYIASLLKQKGVNPANLCFEITEATAISHFANSIKFIESVRALGARIAVDDFGQGLSSFAYLRDLPVDLLKFDGQIVKEIATCSVSYEMLKAMNQIAKAMSLETVAKNVENAAISRELQGIGIDHAQGWHLGKPTSLEALRNANSFAHKNAA